MRSKRLHMRGRVFHKKRTAHRRPEFREEVKCYPLFITADFVWISSWLWSLCGRTAINGPFYFFWHRNLSSLSDQSILGCDSGLQGPTEYRQAAVPMKHILTTLFHALNRDFLRIFELLRKVSSPQIRLNKCESQWVAVMRANQRIPSSAEEFDVVWLNLMKLNGGEGGFRTTLQLIDYIMLICTI